MNKFCCSCCTKGVNITINKLDMNICSNCGLFWRSNDILPENYYEHRTFDEQNLNKLNDRYKNFKSRIKIFQKYTDLNNLCDLGTGEGTFLHTLKDMGLKNILGVEPSIYASDYANKNSLKIYREELEKLDSVFLKNHNLKTITMLHVIEHIKDPFNSVKSLFDSMGSGDTLIIETPDWSSYVLNKNKNIHELVYPEHLFYFNYKSLKLLLEKVGFFIVAKGNTDWNEDEMSIRSSLIRLGLMPYKRANENKTLATEDTQKIVNISKSSSITKNLIRKILIKIVKLLGRGNFIWIIARKK